MTHGCICACFAAPVGSLQRPPAGRRAAMAGAETAQAPCAPLLRCSPASLVAGFPSLWSSCGRSWHIAQRMPWISSGGCPRTSAATSAGSSRRCRPWPRPAARLGKRAGGLSPGMGSLGYLELSRRLAMRDLGRGLALSGNPEWQLLPQMRRTRASCASRRWTRRRHEMPKHADAAPALPRRHLLEGGAGLGRAPQPTKSATDYSSHLCSGEGQRRGWGRCCSPWRGSCWPPRRD